MEKRTLILDVDQTLASGVVPAHMTLYNERLDLKMTTEEIEKTHRFPKTFDVPQIIEHRGKGKEQEDEFQRVRAEIRTSESVHLALIELPGSVGGVLNLLNNDSQIIFGGYYSVRPTEVESATRQWLKMKNFPNPENVIICEDPKGKLTRIINNHLGINANGSNVILIDDSLKELTEAAKTMVSEDPNKRKAMERLIVVGFGQTESKRAELEGSFYPQTGLRTLALPSWHTDNISGLKRALLIN
ncbi:MAG: hypothetical protein Q8P26_00480 [Candidatus Levybacteria bacterium]|nr:hypothetical protein [Candidatus Levybacteria bacterium]